MSGKVAIVTGSNTGIGYRAAELLCEAGVEVILACRSEERGKEAERRIKEKYPNGNVTFMKLDLTELISVKEFADQFLSLKNPLHILVLNAGVLKSSGPRETTKDGFELHMGTNHVGHFLLTSLLLQKLKEAGTPDSKARIVVVASTGHKGMSLSKKDLDFDDIHLEKRGAYSGGQAYKNSKLGNIMMTLKLSRMLANDNVIVNTMCPGLVADTEIFRHSSSCLRCFLKCILCCCYPCLSGIRRSLDHGGGLITHLAMDPSVEGMSGQYYVDFKPAQPSVEARNEEKQDKLWQATKEMILAGDRFPGLQLF